MPARPLGVVSAVVDDDDETAEGVPYRIGGPHVGGHVLVGIFAPCEATVERVDADHDRLLAAKLRPDGGDQLHVVDNQIEGRRHEVEGWSAFRRRQLLLAERAKSLAITTP
jgi:hypothetical protein